MIYIFVFMVCSATMLHKKAYAAATDDWLIQLGAFHSQALATQTWQKLNAKHAALLDGLTAEYQETGNDKGKPCSVCAPGGLQRGMKPKCAAMICKNKAVHVLL